MWPLSLVLLVATAAPPQQQAASPQQQATPPHLTAQQKRLMEMAMQQAEKAAKEAENQLRSAKDNTCFTMRSYFFRRQDGQAPVPAGMTTCTPAIKFQQKWVITEPGLKSPPVDSKIIDQQPSPAENTCFTMRSYYFHRQDGQAPVLASTSTCTPASKLQQRQVSPNPGTLYVPLEFAGR